MAKEIDKQKALDDAIKQIKKTYGEDSVMKLSDGANMNVEALPTGSLALDYALGIGGAPRGRIIEIYGPESSGKTTIALTMAAETQKRGGTVGFIDAEHALDPVYAKNIGVDVEELYMSQPDSGEQALDIADALVKSGALDLVIIDSVAALTPQAEIDGDMGSAHVGLQARLMSQACRKLTAAANKSDCTIIFINQLREKVGVMFGNPEVTPGGRALKFYASVRLDVRRTETVKDNGSAVSNKTKIKVVKNKVAPPYKEAFTEITFGEGIDKVGELIDIASSLDYIKTGGAGWYNLPSGDKIQGRANLKEFFKEHPDEYKQLYETVRETLFTPPESE